MIYKTSKISLPLLFLVFALGALFASPVFADENSLIVEFEETPLFDEANFLPGNSITRFAKVTNNTEGAQNIIIESINMTDPDSLGNVLNIQITESATELYNDTLSNFFAAGEILLSELAGSGTQTQYDVTVSFQSSANDPFQEKSLGFDVLIGFQGEETEITLLNSGGGGGVSLPPGLVIQSESVKVIDIGEVAITVTWTTSFPSTSQVIYAADGEERGLDLSALNYGYPHASPDPEDVTKVINHSVTITGLTPETTYFFRTVSHASPPTISREGNFETLAFSRIVELGELGEPKSPSVKGEQGSFPSDDLQGSGQGASNGDAIKRTTGDSQEEQKNVFELFQASVIASAFTPGLLILAAVILLILFFSRKRRKKKTTKPS